MHSVYSIVQLTWLGNEGVGQTPQISNLEIHDELQ